MTSDDRLGKTYQCKNEIEHVLEAPDTYVGSVSLTEAEDYVIRDGGDGPVLERRAIQYVPALLHLFDEGLVNARDHSVRMAGLIAGNDAIALPVRCIDVNVDVDTGIIAIANDGCGIDVAKHPDNEQWIPSLIFGQMRTSTNYNKDEERVVGGKNGFGVKLINIWSTSFEVETVDHVRKKLFNQKFANNMTVQHDASIKSCARKPYTRITFTPDYKRMGIERLTSDTLDLMRRRVYDIAAVTDPNVQVRFNGVKLGVRNLTQYVKLFPYAQSLCAHEAPNERWEYVVVPSPYGEFRSVSFVNGIRTTKGGKHVDYIVNQITSKIVALIKKKRSDLDVKASTIKEQLMLFLNCTIVNPSFDSQTKDYLNTQASSFGSKCVVSPEAKGAPFGKLADKVAKFGIMDIACAMTEIKENRQATKKVTGKHTVTIRGIPKLVDANYAGGARSSECMLLLVEGDSAKAGAVSGQPNRDTVGIFPLKGKLLNVRGLSAKDVCTNVEIEQIIRILGLELGREYTAEYAAKHLRYGRVVFLTDQDLDGDHIKGLGINMFHVLWPSLMKLPGFICTMHTPLIKVTRGAKVEQFYTMQAYEAWSLEHASPKHKVKYYKGLGTSTGAEWKEYIGNMRIVSFCETETSNDRIDMMFNKKRADERKVSLMNYDPKSVLDFGSTSMGYDAFVERGLIHFSNADCQRSLPHLMDGLKVGQRKCLFAAFKRNLKSELKVAQLSGYISEVSAYHHGEASLNGTIINMAQTFVGSNNIHTFMPSGQFGTRLKGGSDSASPRYIYTYLNPVVSAIHVADDRAVLDYHVDDGVSVEPHYYAPIIPMLLVNGAKGIGTGFSTEIVSHSARDVIAHVEARLRDEPCPADSHPIRAHFEGFTGSITTYSMNQSHNHTHLLVRGAYTLSKSVLHIQELPVGVWTDDYKEHLDKLMEKGVVRAFVDNSTDVAVNMRVTLNDDALKLHEKTHKEYGGQVGDSLRVTELEARLKLYVTFSYTNMHAFDCAGKLKKFHSVYDIVDAYMPRRMELYVARKNDRLVRLTSDAKTVSNKARFIQMVIKDAIELRNQKSADVDARLTQLSFDRSNDGFAYLTKLPMDSVTRENAKRLMDESERMKEEIRALEATTPREMWLADINALKTQLNA